MLHSMTAFARTSHDTPWGRLTWEFKAVNHRYLEVFLRLPEDLRLVEPVVRERLARRLGRGKVDGVLRLETRGESAARFELNATLLDGLLKAAGAVSQAAAVRGVEVGALRVGDLLRWPGVVQGEEADREALVQSTLSLLDRALDELLATRAREGARLASTLSQRLDAIADIMGRAQALQPDWLAAGRQRLLDRLAEARTQLDPQRLEQEMVLFAARTDVAEELDRLATHVAEVRRVLGAGGQSGRRLDFLMQEMHREANTLGAKSQDTRQTACSVDLKVLIEQMREQVQNIE